MRLQLLVQLLNLLNVRDWHIRLRIRVHSDALINKSFDLLGEKLEQIVNRFAVQLQACLNTDVSICELILDVLIDYLVLCSDHLLDQVYN